MSIGLCLPNLTASRKRLQTSEVNLCSLCAQLVLTDPKVRNLVYYGMKCVTERLECDLRCFCGFKERQTLSPRVFIMHIITSC